MKNQNLFVHQHDKDGSCAARGQDAVDAFLELCDKHNLKYKKCSPIEDKRHKDYYVWFLCELETMSIKLPTGKRKVDVKSSKSIRRNKKTIEEMICLELHGSYGLGWILGNEDDNIIAFHIKSANIFYLVKVRELKSYIVKLCDEKIISLTTDAKMKSRGDNSDYEPFGIYRRNFPDKVREKFMYVPLDQLLANVEYFVLK